MQEAEQGAEVREQPQGKSPSKNLNVQRPTPNFNEEAQQDHEPWTKLSVISHKAIGVCAGV
jgi:hypothetical protein